jgi:hypothetical protein
MLLRFLIGVIVMVVNLMLLRVLLPCKGGNETSL